MKNPSEMQWNDISDWHTETNEPWTGRCHLARCRDLGAAPPFAVVDLSRVTSDLQEGSSDEEHR